LTDEVRVPALELGINMNIRREDAEYFRLRVSTEEQLLLRNILTVLKPTRTTLLYPNAGALGNGWSDAVRSICEKPGGEAMITTQKP